MSWWAQCDYIGCGKQVRRPEGRATQMKLSEEGSEANGWRRMKQDSYIDPMMDGKGLWQEIHLCPEHADLFRKLDE